MIKVISVLSLLCACLHYGGGRQYSQLVAVGLLFGVGADIFVEAGDSSVVKGFAFFLVGHIWYMIAFFHGQPGLGHAMPTFGLASMVAFAYVMIVTKNLDHRTSTFVAVYTFVTGGVLAAAMHRWGGDGSLKISQKCSLFGAILLCVSHGIWGWHVFMGALTYGRSMVVVSYYWAQMCICLSTYGGDVNQMVYKIKKKSK